MLLDISLRLIPSKLYPKHFHAQSHDKWCSSAHCSSSTLMWFPRPHPLTVTASKQGGGQRLHDMTQQCDIPRYWVCVRQRRERRFPDTKQWWDSPWCLSAWSSPNRWLWTLNSYSLIRLAVMEHTFEAHSHQRFNGLFDSIRSISWKSLPEIRLKDQHDF